MPKKTKHIFERSINRLSEIIELLESDETALDESITLYKEGVELLESCTAEIKQAELAVAELRQRSDGAFEILDRNESE